MRAVLLALLLAAVPAGAQIYKWVDEKGKVQYGEKPPPGAKIQPMRGEAMPQSPSATPRPPEDISRKEQEFRERQVRQRMQEEKEAARAETNRINCEAVRAQIENTERANIYRREGGEKVYYTEEQKKAELNRLRGLASKYCR